MGCSSCGNSNRIVEPVKYNGEPILTMVEWFQSLGWVFVGNCGCRENHKVFAHKEIIKWQLWVHQLGNSVQFRRVNSAADIVRKGMSGLQDYKQGYQYWVIEYDKKFEIS